MQHFIASVFSRLTSRRVQVSVVAAAIAVLVSLILLLALILPRQQSLISRETQTVPLEVTSNHTYADGVHTVAGTLTLRNRCQRLSSSAFVDESVSPAILRVDLTSDEDEGICLEIPDIRPFTVSAPGPADVRVEVFVNGLSKTGSAF